MSVSIERLDEIFADVRDLSGPGCAVGIIKAGRLTDVACYGSADLEHDVPITSDTVFDIGSTSKQFTAAALLLACEDGLVSLDDSLGRHLPEFKTGVYDDVTLRHLLHHTSGITDYIGLLILSGRALNNDYPTDEIVGLIAGQRGLDFAPGTRFSYSNSGYLLAGEIVRVVTGQSLRAFAQERLFGPLGMTSTFYRDDYTELIPRRALAYQVYDGGYRTDVPLLDVVGDGAVHTTLSDLARWDAQFYRPDSVVRRLSEQGVLADGATTGYGFGLFYDEDDGVRRVHHAGGWGGYRAQLLRLPDAELSVAVLANVASARVSTWAQQVADAALGRARPPSSRSEAEPALPQPTALEHSDALAAVGSYRSAELAADCVVELDDDGLRLRIGWSPWQRLVPTGPGRFLCDLGAFVTFDVDRLDVDAGHLRLQRFGRRPETHAAGV